MDSVNLYRLMAFLTVTLVFVCYYLTWGKLVNSAIKNTIIYPQIVAEPNYTVQLNNMSDLSMLYFYSSYHVKGVLRLPHSNLNEPIEVWYNSDKKKSRIDYYDGEVKTYQDGNIGLGVKITPRYNSVTKTHSFGCWKKVNKKKVRAQPIIPVDWYWPFEGKLKSFKYIGEDYFHGKLCTKWQLTQKVYDKDNTYTFWAEKKHPPVPVRYEMIGYDTLLTSYYDKYVIDYTFYEKWTYHDNIMKIPEAFRDIQSCKNIEKIQHQGDGGEFVLNPMAEFVSTKDEDDPMESEFHRFKKNHGKVYDKHEHSKRKHIFRHNTRFIHSVNRQNRKFKLKLNPFADMTEKEYNLHKGDLSEHSEHEEINRKKRSTRIHEHYKPRKNFPDIPNELDWRDFGAVSPPRGQGTCGSCWAFASVGAMEGANFIKTGKLVALSEQQLMDCTWKIKGLHENSGNNGCHGGWAWKGMFWGRSNKLATRKSYGPYKGQEGYCNTDNFTTGAKIYGFRRVKRWNPVSLRRAIAYHGPAAVSINSNPLTLKFYSSGILDDKKCSNSTDHAVLAIGYGQENGTNYWLIKNSWSIMWGDKGYIRIKEDHCGVFKKPVVAYNKHLKRNYPWKKLHGRKRHHRKKSHHKRNNKKYNRKQKYRYKHKKRDKYKQKTEKEKSWKGKWLKLGK